MCGFGVDSGCSNKELFTQLPKVELHAHLNGSLTPATVRKLAALKSGKNVAEPSENLQYAFHIEDEEQVTLEECFQMFKVIHEVTDRPELVRIAARAVIKDFAEDNVKYLELRSTPRSTEHMTMQEYVEAIISAIDEMSKECDAIVVKLLVSVDRSKGVDIAEKIVKLAIDLHRKRPDVVVGMDMSGNMVGSKADDYFPSLQRARDAGLRIAIHAAEVHDDEETEQVLHFHPDRIGHGTYIPPLKCKNDRLMALLREKRIPLELCLTSNLKGGTVDSYADHHIGVLLKEKLHFIICTDDKGVFATTLSKEYRIVAETFNLTKEKMWQISLSAVDHIFAGEEMKSQLRELWKKWRENTPEFFA